MPKVKLGKSVFNPVRQREIFNLYVKIGMLRKGIKTQGQLAARMSMDRSVINKRINQGGWKYEELCRLIRLLELSAEEVAQMMGAAERATEVAS
ncbi:hypothetical protein [uncultured Dysosmobacter sp.]|uniref:hypothetical protein n=1 Tax=uncultured Dysosmobacter sp. TaxID=2591384 RepID=UPI00260FF517|nr:hypothetical protein [uncultured Dysosmobacter sp.]